MYATRTTQLIVGIFAILGIIALAILSLSLGKLTLLPKPGYTLYASFDNISGLKTGDQVQLAGVQVGKITQIELKDMRARVAMRVDDGVPIDKDAIASIKTSGIIGDKYVSIALGPSDLILKDGDTIRQTESAFVLEDAIGQLINNSGTSGDSKEKSSNSDKEQKPGKSEK
ncbi:MAG: outer membrane lipid asymmetry maintenance protein MlaD [Candidatus Binatus sp.]|jgi:phospholipid/cholesterol/gamma-HCH transport system substrate-binding protein|uniref:outer membrane lipid asymmetry maintenance protein MlaD n=1 Tax=Candidatus Binatus sp. TaxID=2811406 RepID=UPI003C9BE2EA